MSIVKIEELTETYRQMQEMDYYQILKVDAASSKEAVRMAYFRESKTFHPDRFFRQVSDQELRVINEIYKTIAEAYRVLSDSVKRRQYDRGLATDRAQFLRYDPNKVEEAQAGAAGAEAAGTATATARKGWSDGIASHPMAKKYVREALMLMKRRDYGPAEVQIKLALSLESSNEDIKALSAEIAQLKGKSGAKNAHVIK